MPDLSRLSVEELEIVISTARSLLSGAELVEDLEQAIEILSDARAEYESRLREGLLTKAREFKPGL